MKPLTDSTAYADARRHVTSAALRGLFDGDRALLGIAPGCLDRHAGGGEVAKAFVVSARPGDEAVARDLQVFTRTRRTGTG